MMQKSFPLTIFLLFLLPCFAYGQHEKKTFSFGNISFSLSPKVMEDGSITDISMGIIYNNKFSGDYRYSYTIISKNEEFPDYSDSLNVRNEKIHELFILPIGYRYKSDNALFWIGGGAYYEYNKLNEKGFFDYPELETLNPPRERVNSYTNDFSMHVIGPLLDIKFEYTSAFFDINLLGGIVPVFLLGAREKFGIIPLLGSDKIEHSQTTFGSPYFYLGLDAVICKYVNIGFYYNYSRMKYEAIDYNFDENNKVTWEYPETTTIGHSFNIEASALIPLGGDMRFQVGYGYTFGTLIIDSGEITENKQYLILAAKKIAANK
jgi:hypothetical protein